MATRCTGQSLTFSRNTGTGFTLLKHYYQLGRNGKCFQNPEKMLFWDSTFIQSLNMNGEKALWIKVSKCPKVGRATQILKLAAHPQPHLWKVPTQECHNTYKQPGQRQLGKKKRKKHVGSVAIQREKTHLKGGRGDNQERKHRAWLPSSSI